MAFDIASSLEMLTRIINDVDADPKVVDQAIQLSQQASSLQAQQARLETSGEQSIEKQNLASQQRRLQTQIDELGRQNRASEKINAAEIQAGLNREQTELSAQLARTDKLVKTQNSIRELEAKADITDRQREQLTKHRENEIRLRDEVLAGKEKRDLVGVREKSNIRVEEAGAKKIALGTADIEVERLRQVASQEAVLSRDPKVLESIKKLEDSLPKSARAARPLVGLTNPSEHPTYALIESIKKIDPTRGAALRLQLDANVAEADAQVQRAVAKSLKPYPDLAGSPEVQSSVKNAVLRDPKNAEVVAKDLVEGIRAHKAALPRLLAEEGLALTGGELTRTSGITRNLPVIGKMGLAGASPGIQQAAQLPAIIDAAEAARISNPGSIPKTMVENLKNVVKKVSGGLKAGRLGVVGGIGALLALILSGRGKEEEGPNEAQQLAMLQQLQEQQQKQALTQSLVDSRGAQSSKNSAQAQLLQLQLLQQMGGVGGGNFV